jgi:broad specificity phosphatase PhoE
MTGTPWPSGESEEDIMWRLSPPIAAKSRTTRRRRHIITSDTYMRIAMQRLLNLQRQAVHATPHIRRARGQPDPNTG